MKPLHRIAALTLIALPQAVAHGQCPAPDDGFEDNDTCEARVPIADGVTGDLYVEVDDEDWYEVEVMPGEKLEIDVLFSPPFGFVNSLGTQLLEPATSCIATAASRLAIDTQPGPNGLSMTWSNLSKDSKTVAINVFVFQNAPDPCSAYDLRITRSVDPCAPVVLDAFEPNDACSEAVPAPIGLVQGLTVALEDPDFYWIEVASGERLSVTVDRTAGAASLPLIIWENDAQCAAYTRFSALASSEQSGPFQAVGWTNRSALPKEVLIEVRQPRSSVQPFCSTYDMHVRRSPDPCSLDDVFDNNDSCADARELASGVYPGLWLTPEDGDVYRVRIEPGATLDATLSFNGIQGDLNASLVDVQTIPCEFNPFGANLALGFGSGNVETLSYTNAGAAAMDAFLIVDVGSFSPLTPPRCMRYDLEVVGSSIPETPISRPFCMPAPNITGAGSYLTIDRVPVVGDPALTFRVDGLPNMAFGYLVMSPSNDRQIVVGRGNLCMGAPYFRLPTTVTGANSAGVATMNMPWNQMPVVVAPGASWSFQHWHRDREPMGGTTTNFSSGIEVVWQP